MELIIEVTKTILRPLAIFGLIILTFWLLKRYRYSIRQTLIDLGIRKLELMGVVIEVVQDELVEASKKPYLSIPLPSEEDKQEIGAITERLAPLVAGGRVLWVDDNPSGNTHERAALTRLGIEVQTRRTNDEAKIELRDNGEKYDLVISHLRRDGGAASDRRKERDRDAPIDPSKEPEPEPEGFELLKQIREDIAPTMPFIIYTISSRLQQRKKEAGQKGAHGLTDAPIELYRWVLAWLAARQP
jgi:CheY-like chemotaxis protein